MFRSIIAFLLVVVLYTIMAPFTAQATIHHVSMSGFSFTPSSVAVNYGDTVRWTLVDGIHNTISYPASAKSWNSGTMSTSGQTFQIIIVLGDGPGPFPYRCTFHEGFGMTGTITVTPPDTDGDGVTDANDNCPT
ncbi:MAG: plastocyanin/azurin family copper-binding protein, partial [candidate division Zixibacteria bacterium]|nr:plastocyanin/azurin family copper-binding protein [candidate division Zixibacteria bacterium]